MIGKKKIALCLSGDPRNSMFCFPYIYEAFLKPNKLYETDVYIHTWRNFRALDIYSPKKYKIDKINIDKYAHEYLIDNNFDAIKELDNFTPLLRELSPNANILRNQILMFTGIHRCFNLIENPGEYDYIIRARFDMFFPHRLNEMALFWDLSLDKYDIFTPRFSMNSNLDYCSDMLAIGNVKAMEYYSNILNHIPNIIRETKSIIAETWLKCYLNKGNLRHNEYPITSPIVKQVDITTNIAKNFNFTSE